MGTQLYVEAERQNEVFWRCHDAGRNVARASAALHGPSIGGFLVGSQPKLARAQKNHQQQRLTAHSHTISHQGGAERSTAVSPATSCEEISN